MRHDVFVAPNADRRRRRAATSWSRGSPATPRATTRPRATSRRSSAARTIPTSRSRSPSASTVCAPSSPLASHEEAAAIRLDVDEALAQRARPPRHPRSLHVHDRPGRRARLRRRDQHRAHRRRPRRSRRAHRRREPLRAVGLVDRQRGAAARDERLPGRSRAADAARGALQRHLLAQSRRGPRDVLGGHDAVQGRRGRGGRHLPERDHERPPLQLRRGRSLALGRRAVPGSRERAGAARVRARLGKDRGASRRARRSGLRDGRGQGPARRRGQADRGRACASAPWPPTRSRRR